MTNTNDWMEEFALIYTDIDSNDKAQYLTNGIKIKHFITALLAEQEEEIKRQLRQKTYMALFPHLPVLCFLVLEPPLRHREILNTQPR